MTLKKDKTKVKKQVNKARRKHTTTMIEYKKMQMKMKSIKAALKVAREEEASLCRLCENLEIVTATIPEKKKQVKIFENLASCSKMFKEPDGFYKSK